MENPSKRRKLHSQAREQLKGQRQQGRPSLGQVAPVPDSAAAAAFPLPAPWHAVAVAAAPGSADAAAAVPAVAGSPGKLHGADEATTGLLRICTQLMQGATYNELKDQQIKSAGTKCKGVCSGIRKRGWGAHLKEDDAKIVELAENLKILRAGATSKQVLEIKPLMVAVSNCFEAS